MRLMWLQASEQAVEVDQLLSLGMVVVGIGNRIVGAQPVHARRAPQPARPEFPAQVLALGAADLRRDVDHVGGADGPPHADANVIHGVGREGGAARRVVGLGGADQAQVAGLQEVVERERRRQSNVCRYEVATPDGPLYWDYHSLRHWYTSELAAQDGITPAVLQALVRHSDPRVTERYTHAKRSKVREAVEQIRLPGAPAAPPAAPE